MRNFIYTLLLTFNKYREEKIDNIEKDYSPGTATFLSISNTSKKKITDVFNEYSDVDNGFTKTRIPLKNIFETYPVSRSQAKRIGSRLEQFREVELDFDGVEYIGQGFAHELFFVFANAHPQVKLTPLNMNDNVSIMYRHISQSK